MSVFVDMFARWKGFYPLHSAVTVDDGFDRLNRNFAVYQNVAFAIAASIRVFLHHPSMHAAISCDGFTKFDRIFSTDYCWTQGLYTIREAYDRRVENVPYPGIIPEDVPTCFERQLVSGGRIVCPDINDTYKLTRAYHMWYQWVHIYFWMNVVLFYLPYVAFKHVGFGELKPLLALCHRRVDGECDLAHTVDKASTWLAHKFAHLVHRRPGPAHRLVGVLRRHRLGAAHVLVKLLYLGVSYALFYSTGRVFAVGNFYTYLPDWLREDYGVAGAQSNRTSVLDRLFPKVASCEVKRWGASGLEEEQGMCVLPANVLYQYLFLVQWAVLLTLCVTNTLSLLLAILELPLYSVTYRHLLVDGVLPDSRHLRFVYFRSGTTGRQILHLLVANLPARVLHQILAAMEEKMTREGENTAHDISCYYDKHHQHNHFPVDGAAPPHARRRFGRNLFVGIKGRNKMDAADGKLEVNATNGERQAQGRGSDGSEGDSFV